MLLRVVLQVRLPQHHPNSDTFLTQGKINYCFINLTAITFSAVAMRSRYIPAG